MKEIIIDVELLLKLGLNMNEYLTLYDIANEFSISTSFEYGVKELESLEKKAFIKLTESGIFLREKGNSAFSVEQGLFEEWLSIYPVKVKTEYGGSRALSPESSKTILGKKLKAKWNLLFGKDVKKQQLAIDVLKAEIADKTKSGDLKYMFQATRWLNEGSHESMAYLLEQVKDESLYREDDWM